MVTVGSLLDMPNNETHILSFIVEQLMVLAYEIPSSKYVCMIVGPKSSWYNDIYAYQHD